MGIVRSRHGRRNTVQLGMPQRERELHLAVMGNDRETVGAIINDKADINYPWSNPAVPSVKDSTTPLLAAVSLNHVEITLILLHAGAGVNMTDRRGCTPLYKAAYHGRPVLIDILLKAGAFIDKCDNDFQSPLYICVQNAVVHSSYLSVEKLLAAGASVHRSDKNGQAPIHVAARWKVKDMIRILLRSHSNVNLTDYKGRTPLYVAVSSLSTGLYNEDLKYQVSVLSYVGDRESGERTKLGERWKVKGRTPLYSMSLSVLSVLDCIMRTLNIRTRNLHRYVVVSSFSTGLFNEDLKYQVPSIKMLHSHGCDMLNLVDWLKWKGPGISPDLMADDEVFFQWYTNNFNSTHSLKNLCRLVIQKRLIERANFLSLIPQLPLPPEMHVYLSRRMFHLPP